MTAVRDDLVAKIWDGNDPFHGAPFLPWDGLGYPTSQHRYLGEAIESVRPRIIIEVGVWKGVSTMVMARRAQELDIDCAVIAVDTWLGSAEHMTGVNTKIGLPRLYGYPQVYFTFLSNCRHYEVQDRVVPLPLDSVNACEVLKHHSIVADVIHIDAGHDYRSVKIDLETWWPMLRPGGLLIGDDYYLGDTPWPGVRQAFDEFFGVTVEQEAGKCRVQKLDQELEADVAKFKAKRDRSS
jgi:predicted O-methyltransferase YrrM